MNKRERFFAAVRGEKIDRPPVTAWVHFLSDHLTGEQTAALHRCFLETYDWDVPVAEGGDTYARYLVRMEEMRQSLRILQQAIKRGLPPGPVLVDNPYVALPPKSKVYNEMESLIYHFKLIMHGIQPPVGEVYQKVEGANGELGFYVVSDGTKNPYRVRVRPPCFPIFEAFSHMMIGQTIPDAIAALGSLNIIAGELDH